MTTTATQLIKAFIEGDTMIDHWGDVILRAPDGRITEFCEWLQDTFAARSVHLALHAGEEKEWVRAFGPLRFTVEVIA